MPTNDPVLIYFFRLTISLTSEQSLPTMENKIRIHDDYQKSLPDLFFLILFTKVGLLLCYRDDNFQFYFVCLRQMYFSSRNNFPSVYRQVTTFLLS